MGKAVIFSLASLFIVILFVASSSMVTKFKLTESEMEITRTRVKILNSVINDFENSYFEKILFISSKNALVGLSKYYSETNFRSPNVKKNLEMAMGDVLYQGILLDNKGKFQANLSGYMDYKYTLNGLISNISKLMNGLGLEINELNVSISTADGITQIDPWTIQVKGVFTYFISDKEGTVSWKGFSTKIVNVSVIGLTLYDRYTNKAVVDGHWKLDNGTMTEESVLSKLEGDGTGRGLCVSYCQEE
jgi:hypothetical protein